MKSRMGHVPASSGPQDLRSHPSYGMWMSGKLPLILTSDPGQKNVPDFNPWYFAVCQICRTKNRKII